MPPTFPSRRSTRMKARLAAVAFAIALLAPSARAEDNKPPEGFTALFNGKNLDGWQGNLDMKQRATLPKEKQEETLKTRTKTALENWTVKDGVIVCSGKGNVSLQTAK